MRLPGGRTKQTTTRRGSNKGLRSYVAREPHRRVAPVLCGLAVLAGELTTLKGDIAQGAGDAAASGNSTRFWWIALGGGRVIFGWITGYALATLSRREQTKDRYHLE